MIVRYDARGNLYAVATPAQARGHGVPIPFDPAEAALSRLSWAKPAVDALCGRAWGGDGPGAKPHGTDGPGVSCADHGEGVRARRRTTASSGTSATAVACAFWRLGLVGAGQVDVEMPGGTAPLELVEEGGQLSQVRLLGVATPCLHPG